MAKGFKHGAGGGNLLNFKVVGGTSAPASPKANDIWVNTNQAITSWDFAATEPNRRSGNKNLICYPFYDASKTVNGITFTDNKDGSVNVNGTATANISFYFSASDANNNEMLLGPGTYTLGDDAGSLDSNLYIIVHYSYDNWATTEPQVSCGSRYTTFTLTKPARARAQIWVRSGAVISSKKVRPQLEKGSVATSFVKGDATGQVWVVTGASSTVKFNALKKNGIEVYPLEVKQYVNNAWVAKTAKSYQCGTWVDWWKGELYIQGNEYSAVTGGNTAWLHMSTSDITSLGTVTKSGGRINIKCATKQAAAVGPVNKINLKDYKTLKLNVVDFSGGIINTRTSLCVSTTRNKTSADNKVASKDISGKGLITLDVSSLNGEYYVYADVWCLYVESGAYSMSYDKMYLE